MIKLADRCGMKDCENPITEKGCIDNTTKFSIAVQSAVIFMLQKYKKENILIISLQNFYLPK